jgi:HSP20 family protein
MALLPVRRGGFLTRPGSQPVTGWDPFTEFEDLYQRMGSLMTGAFEGMWQPLTQAWAPLGDLSETDDAYVAEVELPGVHRDDISVELAGQELVITGEYKETGKEGRTLRRGRRAGRFEYRALLPGQAAEDKITATLADGVLTVTVPKTETAKPRRIEITAD